jgi:hypothetical protein
MLVFPSKGVSIILTNERMINDSLMVLVCTTPHTSSHDPRLSLIDILEEIADLRFGEPPYPRPAGFYSGPLYFEVFSLDPVGNVTDRLKRLKSRYQLSWCDPAVLTDALRTFHCDYAYGCERQQMDRPNIIELIDKFMVTVI